MKILVEILHPAHVHFFKNAIALWRRRGDTVHVFSRRKDCAEELARECGIQAEILSSRGRFSASLVPELFIRLSRLYLRARHLRPDIVTGVMGATIAPLGRLLGRPSVVFYDTEIARLTNAYAYRLADRVCLPACYQGATPANCVFYPGYKELAYLHPAHFTPDPKVIGELGADAKGYVIVRFVSSNASHDLFLRGLDLESKRRLVRELSRKSRVFVSSEDSLPADLQPYRFPLKASRFHDALAFARLALGESATVSSEAAVLGTPAVFIGDSSRGYLDELSRSYGLVSLFPARGAAQALEEASRLLQEDSRPRLQAARARLLSEKRVTSEVIIEQIDEIHRESFR